LRQTVEHGYLHRSEQFGVVWYSRAVWPWPAHQPRRREPSPLGVRRAFLWMSIRSSANRYVWQHQLSWPGPNGQPPESSHLAGRGSKTGGFGSFAQNYRGEAGAQFHCWAIGRRGAIVRSAHWSCRLARRQAGLSPCAKGNAMRTTQGRVRLGPRGFAPLDRILLPRRRADGGRFVSSTRRRELAHAGGDNRIANDLLMRMRTGR
jgi:hypothetical protein